MKFADSEFFGVSEQYVTQVCAVIYDDETRKIEKFWMLNNPQEQKRFKEYVLKFKEEIWFSYAAIAEGRYWISSNLDPVEFKWIDGFLEWRCLTNHNDALAYGMQLVDGKPKMTKRPPPKWERSEEDSKYGFKQTHSLAECTYKLLGEIRDTEHKNKMRDIIISGDIEQIELNKDAIMEYCVEDTIYLPAIFERMCEEYEKLLSQPELDTLIDEMLLRGKYSALTANMESYGYPINVRQTRNFANSVKFVLEECQREINSLFPDVKPFRWERSKSKFTWDQKVTKDWIRKNCDVNRWMKTDKKDISLSLEAFQKFFDFKHDYPKDNFGAQMVRYLKLKQNLNGFTPSPKKKSFWDYVGSDGRVRPYMNIYGAQSSRSQPAATGFLFLKPAWMRSLCQPNPGRAIASFDYGSQEFLISALVSKDKNMIDSYKSNDVYLAFAKLAGAVPPEGTKAEYKAERDLFKSTLLGVSYLMTRIGLAAKLTADIGKPVDEDQAQGLIDLFYASYPDFADWQEEAIKRYMEDGETIKLPCVAEGTWIYTDKGRKEIQELLPGDLVWDGIQFVKHGGLALRGEKAVMSEKTGLLSATKDHLVLALGKWRPMWEVVEEGYPPHTSEKFLADGRLLEGSVGSTPEGMSFLGAYVVLRNTLESTHCNLAELEPVLTALTLETPKNLSPQDLATYLMINIFGVNGERLIIMQKLGARIRTTFNSKTMEVGGFDFASNPLESSWNTLLLWMGTDVGMGHSIELTTTDIMKLEIFESSLTKKTTITKSVYDIVNCGPRNRFQAGDRIVHNCGWRLFPDNDNFRSAANAPIQGFGACVMRKAVEFCHEAGLKVIFTLHDAVYIEYDSNDLSAIDTLRDCMHRAFVHYFDNKEDAGIIRLDGKCWSPDYEDDSELITPKGLAIDCSKIFVDERAGSEYEQFSGYFEDSGADLL